MIPIPRFPGSGFREESGRSVRFFFVPGPRKYLMYNDISPEILAVIEPVARAYGFEVVDASVKPARGQARVLVFLDTPAGDGRVGVEDCARVSREISHGLDATDALPGAYLLEVSSPGIDRVLGRAVDFERAVGQRVSLELREPREGRRRFKGDLVGFSDDCAHLRAESEDVRIPLDQILRAKALLSTDTSRAKR